MSVAPLLTHTLPRPRGVSQVQHIHHFQRAPLTFCRTFFTFKKHLSHFAEHSVAFYNAPFQVWTQLHKTETHITNSLWHASRCKWLRLKSTYATMACQTRLVRYAKHSSLLNRRLVKCAHSYTNMHYLSQIICDIRHVANGCVSKVLTPPWFAKLDLSDMQNIRHFWTGAL